MTNELKRTVEQANLTNYSKVKRFRTNDGSVSALNEIDNNSNIDGSLDNPKEMNKNTKITKLTEDYIKELNQACHGRELSNNIKAQIEQDILKLMVILKDQLGIAEKIINDLCVLKDNKDFDVDSFSFEVRDKYGDNFDLLEIVDDLAYLITGENKLVQQELETKFLLDDTLLYNVIEKEIIQSYIYTKQVLCSGEVEIINEAI